MIAILYIVITLHCLDEYNEHPSMKSYNNSLGKEAGNDTYVYQRRNSHSIKQTQQDNGIPMYTRDGKYLG